MEKTYGFQEFLSGHTSAETAYVVEDYPWGFKLRCKKRYWVEKAEKGAKKGLYRFVSQTTDPRKPSEYWNKPKASTYHSFAVLYKDSKGHIHCLSLPEFPWADHCKPFLAIRDRLDEETRKELDRVLDRSRKDYPECWAKIDAESAAQAQS